MQLSQCSYCRYRPSPFHDLCSRLQQTMQRNYKADRHRAWTCHVAAGRKSLHINMLYKKKKAVIGAFILHSASMKIPGVPDLERDTKSGFCFHAALTDVFSLKVLSFFVLVAICFTPLTHMMGCLLQKHVCCWVLLIFLYSRATSWSEKEFSNNSRQ